MCGIVGYVGARNAVPIVLEGLKRLEYRGYDSAGVALLTAERITVVKRVGNIKKLEEALRSGTPAATIGMGHTRWATHGEPDEPNAHPHLDCRGEIALVHNGVIENYAVLKRRLLDSGHVFRSETDTEVIVHLIEEFHQGHTSLEDAVRRALTQVKGTYGVAVVCRQEPDKLVVARNGSPIAIGVGDGEHIVASDASAIVAHTRKVLYLEDGEMAVVTADSVRTTTLAKVPVEKFIQELTLDLQDIERGEFEHFMLKEIHEQPETIRNAMRGRLLRPEEDVKLGGLEHVKEQLLRAKRFIFLGCGTSWHAALVGEYLLEQIAGVQAEVEYASEFRYRNPIVGKGDVVFAISQSGETADTLAALREAKSRGATALGIVNVVGSTIARESDGGVYIHAGPEIGVASTKAFTSQLTVLALITMMLARARGVAKDKLSLLLHELEDLPEKVEEVLLASDRIRGIAEEFKSAQNFLYLGRGANFPVALEGALKLKEISYIHAEGYPAAEMKHGPIALIDENMPVVVIAPKDSIYEKVVSNIQEVRARKGRLIIIANEDDQAIANLAEHVIRVPRTYGYFGPILNVIPLQLLAYHIAVARGANVDQPRNLAKSVTVE
ncbi:MAG: glutamine--fructose-6-phosphate aminotransferase [Ignavibacteria bacterium GWA2_54_16]|nr:MAG: glutamine--fructose-6-phosphate aminotransferase [Ignavibacteria bacterium GWA2_54_16]